MSLLDALIILLSFLPFASPWQTLGSTIVSGNIVDISTLGSVVDMSQDGRRVAIGSPESGNGSGVILLYELDDLFSTWNLVTAISGQSGEGLGDFFSLSPDGLLIAVRHHLPNAVQVYKVNEDGSIGEIGSDVRCGSTYGHSVTLAQVDSSEIPSPTHEHGGGKYWLVVGCEGYDKKRGKVKVYELHDKPSYHWSPFHTHLTGRNEGDYFGAVTAFVEAFSTETASGRVFRLAVGSPLHNQGQGIVQVFRSDYSVGWSQQGEDLVGASVGEFFGVSLDISSSEHPYLVVGSPRHTRVSADGDEERFHGMAKLFQWKSSAFGEPRSWQLVDSPVEGVSDGEEFGMSVSLSNDGRRFASSSNLITAVYELESYNNLTLVQDTIDLSEEIGASGYSIAMSGSGSVIVSLNSMGDSVEVQALIDETSFCQSPIDFDETEAGSTISDFMDRTTCRAGGINLIRTREICLDTTMFVGGQYVSCEWVPSYHTLSPSGNPTFVPSVSPSNNPSTLPSIYSSAAPSSFPTPTTDVDDDLSANPTLAPSSKPTSKVALPETAEPSLLTSGLSSPPSHGPTPMPSIAPSSIGSTPPSLNRDSMPSTMPTAKDSMESSSNPTSSPSIVTIDWVTSCQCDENGICIDSPLDVDTEFLRICVTKEKAGVDIIAIDEFSLVQGNLTVPVIQDMENKMDSDSTVSTRCNQDSCQIHLPVIPPLFFDDGRPSYLFATGRLFMTQQQQRHRRNLRLQRRASSSSSSSLLHEGQSVAFGTIIMLEQPSSVVNNNSKDKESSSTTKEANGTKKMSSINNSILWLVLGIASLIGSIIVASLYYKRKRLSGGD